MAASRITAAASRANTVEELLPDPADVLSATGLAEPPPADAGPVEPAALPGDALPAPVDAGAVGRLDAECFEPWVFDFCLGSRMVSIEIALPELQSAGPPLTTCQVLPVIFSTAVG